jgi:hypothetical protein
MKKDELLKSIAENGYNVGYGAKKHFATYDIVEKAPGWIAFISIAIGILAFVIPNFNSAIVSACLIVFGIGSLYINLYNDKKEAYSEAGTKLTKHFNALKDLYYLVQSSTAQSFDTEYQKMQAIRDNYYNDSITKQIFLSSTYAHYKFFWQHQIKWVDEQLKFRLFRDKLPLPFTASLLLIFLATVGYYFYK